MTTEDRQSEVFEGCFGLGGAKARSRIPQNLVGGPYIQTVGDDISATRDARKTALEYIILTHVVYANVKHECFVRTIVHTRTKGMAGGGGAVFDPLAS